MSKKNKIFGKSFRGCFEKEIYPTKFHPGDDVPFSLEKSAEAVGAIEDNPKKAAELVKARNAEIKAQQKADEVA